MTNPNINRISNTDYQYVRLKSDPDQYLMAGYSDFTGQFDDTLYEVVSAPLPKTAVKQVAPHPLLQLETLIGDQPTSARAQLYPLQAALHMAYRNNDTAAALALVQQAAMDSAVLKDALVAVIQAFETSSKTTTPTETLALQDIALSPEVSDETPVTPKTDEMETL